MTYTYERGLVLDLIAPYLDINDCDQDLESHTHNITEYINHSYTYLDIL